MTRIERAVLRLIQPLASTGSSVLELAPGKGSLTQALLNAGYRKIEAIDIHPENFAVPGVTCHRGNLSERLPFDDGSFDLVISVEGIEHLEHQYRFAAEISRVLKPGGLTVITTPNIANFSSRVRFLLTGFYSLAERPSSEFEKNWVIEHIYPLTFWQLRHILHTNGLVIKHITTDKLRRSARLGFLLYPFCYFATWLELRKEPDARQRSRNRDILKQMYALPLFLGRTQIVLAQKQDVEYAR